jgi:uncharacterized integral membrane protein
MAGNAKLDRTPMMLSAFVYPGAGQFLQKRWIAGTLFSILFTIFSLALIFEVFKPMFHNVNVALNFAAAQGDQPFEGISLSKVILSFIALMVVYIANILDILRANRKRIQPPPLPTI